MKKIVICISLIIGILLNCNAQKQKNKIHPTDKLSVTGIVVSESGIALQGAKIEIEWLKCNKRGNNCNARYNFVVSDSNGKFPIELPVVPNKLVVTKTGCFETRIEKPDSSMLVNGIKLIMDCGGRITVTVEGLEQSEYALVKVKAVILGREYPANTKYSLSASLVFNQASGHVEPNMANIWAHYHIDGIPSSAGEIIVEYRKEKYSKTLEIKAGIQTTIRFELP